jgi:hypothetical protein
MSTSDPTAYSAIITSQTPYVLIPDNAPGDSSPDIRKLILANGGASAIEVTLNDGQGNLYYYVVPATSTVIDNSGVIADYRSSGWTLTAGAGITNLYVSCLAS